MARDDEDRDWTREHEAALAKFARKRARLEETYEAQEEAIREVTKKALTQKRKALNQEFLNSYTGRVSPDQRLIDFLRDRNDGVSNDEYEPNPTGFEDRYWEKD